VPPFAAVMAESRSRVIAASFASTTEPDRVRQPWIRLGPRHQFRHQLPVAATVPLT
jgi:hypothetical protein